MLRRALATKGFREASPAQEPELLIMLACGIGPTSTKKKTINDNELVGYQQPPRMETFQVGVDRNGKPIMETKLNFDNAEPIFVPVTRAVDLRLNRKQLHLRAYRRLTGDPASPPAEAWATDAFCDTEDRDMSAALPRLVAASMNYIGKDSAGTVIVRVKDDDRIVSALRTGK